MLIGRIRCALGRHQVDRRTLQSIYGRPIGRCTGCRQVLEQDGRDHWVVSPLHDAGLGHRPR